jgi:hypothetical protein
MKNGVYEMVIMAMAIFSSANGQRIEVSERKNQQHTKHESIIM